MNLPPQPGIEAEIDKIVAECETRLAAQAAVAAAALHETRNPAVEKEGAHTSGGAGAAAAKPSAVPLSFAAPRLEAAPASIPLVASLLAGAAAVGVGAVGEAVCDPLSSPFPLTPPTPFTPTAHAAEPADIAPLSSSQPSASRATPVGVGCSSLLRATEIAALRAEMNAQFAALRAETGAELAVLRARVAALEAENASLRR